MSNRIANVIPHMKSYVLGKRTISIHSYDRDKNKFKEANEFEIKLPETFTNIQAIRLVNLDMPENLFVFANKYQNTKLSFKLLTGTTGTYTIEIQEGRYTLALFSDRNNDKTYTPGIAKPLTPAEWFYVMPDTIEIRANWDIEMPSLNIQELY